MPTTLKRTELLELARAGAQARLSALEAEIASIHRAFPGLRSGSAARGRRATANATGATTERRRRGWTAAQRKAAAERMRKYWANRKSKK